MKNNPIRAKDGLLVAVPILLVVVGVWLLVKVGGFPADPEYSYLLNGLEVLTFYPPSYISHPGTNLIMLIAAINFLTWLVTWPFHGTGLVADVLTRPEFYLDVHFALLMAFIAGAAFWFGLRLRRASGSWTVALAGQASLLISPSVMIALDRVSPEPFLLGATLVLAGLSTPLAFGREENPRRAATAMGLTLGFCIAAKITSLPLIFVLLLLPDWRLRKRAALFTLGSAICFTLPAAHHYPQMFSWFTGMATHSGSYSDGPVGLPTLPVLLSYSVRLATLAPELLIGGCLYAAFALFGARPLRRTMAGCALVMAAQMFMVLKQPDSRYLVPAAAIFALGNAIIAAQILLSASRRGLAMLVGAGVAGLCYTAVLTLGWARDSHAAYVANTQQFARATTSGCTVIYYYEAPAVLYNLDFGNQYAGSRFSNALKKLYPRAFTYDWARRSFMFFDERLSPADVEARVGPERCINLVGSHLDRFKIDFGIPRTAMIPVSLPKSDDGRWIAIYRYQP
jgi:hypothetical protein